MSVLKHVLAGGAIFSAATSFGDAQKREVLALPEDEVPAIDMVTGFHSMKDKTNDLIVRVLEADGSSTVAHNPVALFLVITNDAGGRDLQEHSWRLPRGVAEVKKLRLHNSVLNISVLVDGPPDKQTWKGFGTKRNNSHRVPVVQWCFEQQDRRYDFTTVKFSL